MLTKENYIKNANTSKCQVKECPVLPRWNRWLKSVSAGWVNLPGKPGSCSQIFSSDLFVTISYWSLLKCMFIVNNRKTNATFTLEQTITDSWVKLLKIEIIKDYAYTRF